MMLLSHLNDSFTIVFRDVNQCSGSSVSLLCFVIRLCVFIYSRVKYFSDNWVLCLLVIRSHNTILTQLI